MEQEEIQNIEEDNNIQPIPSKWTADRMMGIAAIFISVLSMFSVIYQSYLSREENELIRIQQSATVLPYLSDWFIQTEGKFKVVIGNKGVGPAFIKEVQFTAIDLETKDSVFFNNSDQLSAFMEQQSVLLDTIPFVGSTFRANMLLSQNETKELFVYSYDTHNQGRLIRKEYQKFSVSYTIVYEDVYGTAWILHSKGDAPVKIKKD